MEKSVSKSRVEGSLKAPSSKSYAQRAIAAALLAKGETTLLSMELCNDTRASLNVACELGAKILSCTDEGTYIIGGGLSASGSILNIGESGLATRMFTPIASLCSVPLTITGAGSILSRPMDMMLKPLVELGVEVQSANGFLPVTVRGTIRGGEIVVDGSVSSQFITGLLMALPLALNDTVLRVLRPTSIPYLQMTIDLLRSFEVEIGCNEDYTEYFIEGGQNYTPCRYNVEGDWSGASCLLVAGAIAGDVTVKNLNPLSIQADVAIIDALSKAGAEIITTPDSVRVVHHPLSGFEMDATHCPDLFPALVALAANCTGETILKGTSRLTHKESNRAHTLSQEFGKMGIEVDISQHDTMRIVGGNIHSAYIDSHNDHRIAMSTSVAALCSDAEVIIGGAESVDKSYPKYWNDLDALMKGK